ncbi:hypothetical protein SCP_1701160 [Sparassis crispa]|uniref:DUF6532 domain-containing protein n=1 Tax=Sparassis crispa TaxID=139825 RepID=A0A401H5X8_9APHY|nr:hypothetical protein SCP_1701160 [Sparassis crispa]GBE89791.1 hypothetical protein SCP_1701160 [Sparassis crispa]
MAQALHVNPEHLALHPANQEPDVSSAVSYSATEFLAALGPGAAAGTSPFGAAGALAGAGGVPGTLPGVLTQGPAFAVAPIMAQGNYPGVLLQVILTAQPASTELQPMVPMGLPDLTIGQHFPQGVNPVAVGSIYFQPLGPNESLLVTPSPGPVLDQPSRMSQLEDWAPVLHGVAYEAHDVLLGTIFADDNSDPFATGTPVRSTARETFLDIRACFEDQELRKRNPLSRRLPEQYWVSDDIVTLIADSLGNFRSRLKDLAQKLIDIDPINDRNPLPVQMYKSFYLHAPDINADSDGPAPPSLVRQRAITLREHELFMHRGTALPNGRFQHDYSNPVLFRLVERAFYEGNTFGGQHSLARAIDAIYRKYFPNVPDEEVPFCTSIPITTITLCATVIANVLDQHCKTGFFDHIRFHRDKYRMLFTDIHNELYLALQDPAFGPVYRDFLQQHAESFLRGRLLPVPGAGEGL